MALLDEALNALSGNAPTVDSNHLALRRKELEADLEPLVRCALRNGTGVPVLVRWVQRALPGVVGPECRGAAAERAAPLLARLLCRTLVNQFGKTRSNPMPPGPKNAVDY